MNIVESIAELRTLLANLRQAGKRIGFVPTMGNLHEGHLSLVHKAKEVSDQVVVSIYVNPMQFGAGEDFASYPRTLEADCDKLNKAGGDWVFTPTDDMLYPQGKDRITYIDVPVLDTILEGKSRPSHFRGVATIVNKLFNIVQPDVAVFGEKDFQQLLVIRHMVADLNMPVEIIGVPTMREASGLAMSSRNGYLSATEKDQAAELYRTLSSLRDQVLAGEQGFSQLSVQACDNLQSCGFCPEYVAICRASDLQTAETGDSELVILAAARLGTTRLIDNLRV